MQLDKFSLFVWWWDLGVIVDVVEWCCGFVYGIVVVGKVQLCFEESLLVVWLVEVVFGVEYLQVVVVFQGEGWEVSGVEMVYQLLIVGEVCVQWFVGVGVECFGEVFVKFQFGIQFEQYWMFGDMLVFDVVGMLDLCQYCCVEVVECFGGKYGGGWWG